MRDDCSGIKVGNSYCVEVNFGLPRTTSTVGTTSQTTTAATGASAPSPTQAGLIGACTAFYRAVAGDTCDRIASKYGIFSTADFLAWNPAVGADCSGLWASYYYCVGVPGTPTTKPTDTSASPTSKPAGPSPTQDGIVSTCVNYYKAVSGDTCAKIVDRYGTFTADEFYSWNPAVGTDCLGLWSGYNYCVGIAGTPTAKPATLSTTTTKPTPSGPSPAQPGITSTCTQYYKAVSGDTCAKIVDTYGTFTLDQFTSWNPAVSSDCSGLWVGYYYCIGTSKLSILAAVCYCKLTTYAFSQVYPAPRSRSALFPVHLRPDVRARLNPRSLARFALAAGGIRLLAATPVTPSRSSMESRLQTLTRGIRRSEGIAPRYGWVTMSV